jgi:SAM-dependent methyltransferase
MEPTTQDVKSFEKNQHYFSGNEWYKTSQTELELYKFIAMCAAHETEGAERLLDIGNGGVFIYPIDGIEDVEAVDIFVEEDFKRRYPKVKWSQMSALEMRFDKPFDTVIAINTLHHIIGPNVVSTYENLDRVMAEVSRLLEPHGKFVVLESTVPRWFLYPYKLVFRLLVKIWPLKHPPTFQFYFRDIIAAAQRAGLELKEFCWVPKTSDYLTMGIRVKKWMTPIQVGKFVFSKLPPPGQGNATGGASV